MSLRLVLCRQYFDQHEVIMIAAIVLLALVASTQAFPGSDPVSHMMAAVPHHPQVESLRAPNPLCFVGFIGEVREQLAAVGAEAFKLKGVVGDLVANISGCDDDKLTCVSQKIRDSWEGNAELRVEVETLAESVLALAIKIKEKCLD